MRSVLLLFIRNPRPGRVKTRLASTVGDAEALRIYRLLLDETQKAAMGTRAERWLFYSDDIDPDDNWLAADFRKFRQEGSDLGKRMENAFRTAFEAGAEKAIIIGSDCPELSGSILEYAFEQLEASDFVLGPADDGGYYLLGMRAFEPALFHGVAWSTDTVASSTLNTINDLGKTVATLEILSDVDTEADWKRFSQKEL
jgi:hypothetical protein